MLVDVYDMEESEAKKLAARVNFATLSRLGQALDPEDMSGDYWCSQPQDTAGQLEQAAEISASDALLELARTLVGES